MLDGFINCSVDFPGRNTANLCGTAVEECLELSSNGCPAFRRRNLLRRNRHNADLLVRSNRTTQELFYGGLNGVRQFTGFLD